MTLGGPLCEQSMLIYAFIWLDDDAVTATNNQKEENEKAGQASGHSVETDLDATREEYQGHGSGFFFSLFLVMAILCVGGYLFWHNRKKVGRETL